VLENQALNALSRLSSTQSSSRSKSFTHISTTWFLLRYLNHFYTFIIILERKIDIDCGVVINGDCDDVVT